MKTGSQNQTYRFFSKVRYSARKVCFYDTVRTHSERFWQQEKELHQRWMELDGGSLNEIARNTGN